MKSGSECGLLYMFMIVCIGLFFCLLLCICMVTDAVCGILRGRMVLCMSSFV